MKKILSILCSLAILCCTTVSAASAADTAGNADTANEVLFPDFKKLEAGEIPRVYIDSVNNDAIALEKKHGYVDASIAVVDTNGSIAMDNGVIKIRGQSNASVEKRPYTFKFNSKQNVLGMGKAKKWWLCANCMDPTMLRNDLALNLGREMGVPYTSDARFAEVFIDGVYRGVFLIVEPVDTGKSRVNIDVSETNPTPDFLLQFEYSRRDASAVYIKNNEFRFEVKAPEAPTSEQLKFITDTTNEMLAALKTKNATEIEKYIDMESFAKYYIINELFKDVDCGFSSTFFFYKNGKFYAGPPWDYDITAGNLNNSYSQNARLCLDTEGLFAHQYHFYSYLLDCREFVNVLRHVYAENFSIVENTYREGGRIDDVLDVNYDAFMRNFSDAGWVLTKRYHSLMRKPDATYEENVAYLRDWLEKRNTWLSGYYDIFGEDRYTVGDVNGDSANSVADAVMLMHFLTSQREFSNVEYLSSDLDSDGNVDVFDMVLMRKMVLESTEEK